MLISNAGIPPRGQDIRSAPGGGRTGDRAFTGDEIKIPAPSTAIFRAIRPRPPFALRDQRWPGIVVDDALAIAEVRGICRNRVPTALSRVALLFALMQT